MDKYDNYASFKAGSKAVAYTDYCDMRAARDHIEDARAALREVFDRGEFPRKMRCEALRMELAHTADRLSRLVRESEKLACGAASGGNPVR